MKSITLPAILIPMLVAGCVGTRPTSSPPTPDSPKTTAIAEIRPPDSASPSIDSMRRLGGLASKGDLAAIDKIEHIHNELYGNMDWKDRDRIRSNLILMRSAFSEIGRSVATSEENDPAFKSLLYATGKSALRGFTADAFGIAAAKGHTPSLQVLTHHNRYGILHSSAIFALRKPAEAGNEEAIKFLIEVLQNDKSKALWHGASRGLVHAANQGNTAAQQALAKYEAYQKERMKAAANNEQGG